MVIFLLLNIFPGMQSTGIAGFLAIKTFLSGF